MSNIVKELHELGRSDAWISRHLGMDRDEILRLKQITGLAALFRDVEFGRAWQPVEAETVVEGGAVKVMDGEAAVALEEEEENGEDESD